MSKKRLPISLDDVERQKLQRLAESRGLSLSRMIGQLIREAEEESLVLKKTEN